MPALCGRCHKPVYFAEEVKALGKKWHKLCLKCNQCNRLLDSGSVTEHDSKPFCRNCHGKLFGPKGFGFSGTLSMGIQSASNGGGSPTVQSNIPSTAEAYVAPRRSSLAATDSPSSETTSPIGRRASNNLCTAERDESVDSFDSGYVPMRRVSAGPFGGAPRCPRCGNMVYVAEMMKAAGRSYHRTCFTCYNDKCGKRLDSSNLCDKDGELYCKACYGRLFGPKGIGYGVGAGVLQSE